MANFQFRRSDKGVFTEWCNFDKTGNCDMVLHKATDSCEINLGLQIKPVVLALLDLSAKVVSKYLPYSYVEKKYLNIPELVTKKILFWSFPRCHSDILRYYFVPNAEENYTTFNDIIYPQQRKSAYWYQNILDESTGIKNISCLGWTVNKIIQIGFCIVGTVSNQYREFNISLTFDRCVITSVKCSCNSECVLWCIHAKTLASYRFFHGNSIEVYMPIFTQINHLDRTQLQKLLQYLLSIHHNHILEIMPNLQHEILNNCLQSNFPDIHDITASVRMNDTPCWFLDINNLRIIKFRPLIVTLLKKIAEMIRVSDKNGLKILQFLIEEKVSCQHINDELIKLWTFTLAAPDIPRMDKNKYCTLIQTWLTATYEFSSFNYLTDEYIRNNTFAPYENTQIFSDTEIKTCRQFLMPLCAAHLSWDDQLLKHILTNEDILNKQSELGVDKQFIWREHLPTSCLRVEALRESGYYLEAIRLSVAIGRAIKDQSRRWKEIWSEIKLSRDSNEELLKDVIHSADGEWMTLSLIKHRLDPLKILFSLLVNASEVIQHKMLTSLERNQYCQIAIEAIIIIFSQQLTSDKFSLQIMKLEEKWMEVIHSALQGDCNYDFVNISSPKFLLNHSSLTDLIETLLQGGVFTSCGDFGYFASPRYNWYLLMTKAIDVFNKNKAAKFVLACLRLQNSNFISNCNYDHEDRWKLVVFVVSTFPEDIASEALDICLEQEGISKIGNFILNLFNNINSNSFDKMTFSCKSTKSFIFHWLLQTLHLSIFSNRAINANTILGIAYRVGFEETIFLLKNWEKYIQLSESMELRLFLFNWHFSIEELTIIRDEECKLAIWYAENKKEDRESVFRWLKKLVYQNYSISPTTDMLKILRCKMFEIGLCCAATKPRKFILQELPALILDEDTFNAYYKLLLDALHQGTIVPEDIMIINTASWTTQVYYAFENIIEISEECKYSLVKLLMKYCMIPHNYKLQSDRTTKLVTHIIDVAKIADQKDQAMEVVEFVTENIKHTPLLFAIIKGCFEFGIKDGRKPYWLKMLLENGLRTLERDTFRRVRRPKRVLENHYQRLAALRDMLREY